MHMMDAIEIDVFPVTSFQCVKNLSSISGNVLIETKLVNIRRSDGDISASKISTPDAANHAISIIEPIAQD